jgi:hypothetical protein
LATERQAVAKTEAAIRCLDAELSQFVRSERELEKVGQARQAEDEVTTLKPVKPVKKEPKKKA